MSARSSHLAGRKRVARDTSSPLLVIPLRPVAHEAPGPRDRGNLSSDLGVAPRAAAGHVSPDVVNPFSRFDVAAGALDLRSHVLRMAARTGPGDA